MKTEIVLSEGQRKELFNCLIGLSKIDYKDRFSQMVTKALIAEVILRPLLIKCHASSLKEAIHNFKSSEYQTEYHQACIRKIIEFSQIQDLYDLFGSIWNDNQCEEESLLIIRKVSEAIING